MTNTLIVTVLIAYFIVLVAISYVTSRKATNDSFFLGERKSPWYIVSFGMIGASLSGVTFISVPGWVGNESNQFSYMQAVLGYLVGYFIVAYVLLPIYYRLNLTSIYEYLKQRFGFWSYKTGAFFFLVSRIIGASVRLLLVANVLQSILFDDWGIPFEVTVIISVLLIWIYTNKGGIKTIVWTDTLQTAFMLGSVFLTVWFISDALDLSGENGLVNTVSESGYAKVFFFDDFMSNNHFLKHFLGGMFITIGMTGLDQDMMQKNLSCKSIKDAQKNMISMAAILVVVNLIFLVLGVLLYIYAYKNAIDFAKPDLLFSAVALSDGAGQFIGVLFLLGLIAAAYSSADSALTSLTTSFSVDFLNINEKDKQLPIGEGNDVLSENTLQGIDRERTRKMVHIAMSVGIILVVILLKYTTTDSAIGLLMKFAGFTYGPLIGIFFFGILSRRKINDHLVPFLCLISIVATFLLWYFSCGAPGVEKGMPGIFGMYKFGFEIIILNALITFILMILLSAIKKQNV
ncbi:MAG: sodium:solute symporter [Crocinitomicaceae bacterium]|nr:sodium:solute symporter [Crocinitomicaceae bacterium]